MKQISGKWLVPVIAALALAAVGWITWKRLSLLDPAQDGPQIGMTMPPIPVLTPGGERINFPEPGRPAVLVVLRGYAGYIDPGCISQTREAAALAATGIRTIVVYPGSDAQREFQRFLDELASQKVDVGGIEWGLDPSLHAMGALDVYGDPGLPSVWAVDAGGVLRARTIGTAASRPGLAEARAVLNLPPQSP